MQLPNIVLNYWLHLDKAKQITIDNPVCELTCLPIFSKEFSLLLITSSCNNRSNCTICIFSGNLWWFVSVCNIAVKAYGLATGVFSLFSFFFLVSDKFGKKYDLFSLLGTGQYLMGTWGRCKRPWGGHFFIALKHGADTFFCSLQSWVGYFFPLSWSQWEDIYRQKMQLKLYFSLKWQTVIEMQLHLKKWTENKILTPRTASTANTMSCNIFYDSTYEKNTIYRNIKYFVS